MIKAVTKSKEGKEAESNRGGKEDVVLFFVFFLNFEFCFLFKFFFFYSYVHTMFGSFLPPSPRPLPYVPHPFPQDVVC
jgi:hypothetical protein